MLQKPSTAKKQLKKQEERWETMCTIPEVADIIAETDPDVIRRILILNRKKPAEAILAYRQLQNKYQYDDYIEPSMIDEAIKWGLRQAASSITRLRSLLRRTNAIKLSLDKEHTSDKKGVTLNDSIVDTKNPDIDVQIISSQIDPIAPTREEKQLLGLFGGLRSEERAAVALVYQIPWLLPEGMRDDGWDEVDKICETFGVRNRDELETLVEVIISKLRNS